MSEPTAHQLNRLLSQQNLFIRITSGLDRRTRLQLQIACEERLAAIRSIDNELDHLARKRRQLVSELSQARDDLWPAIPWKKGRRPPDFDEDPLPPVVEEPIWLFGRTLRSVCITILHRHGELPLRDLHALLHHYGFALATKYPVRVLSDAMGYECEQGRAARVRRGVYRAAAGHRPRPGRFGAEPLGPVTAHPTWPAPDETQVP